jgi:nicotinate-nucleotide pyrophosphorylase (carboxylating)
MSEAPPPSGSRPVGTLDPPPELVAAAVARALAEDLDERGDLTAQLLDPSVSVRAVIAAREHGVLAGEACVTETFRQLTASLTARFVRHDGDRLVPGDVVAHVDGPLAAVVTAERPALNFLGHLSGIATATRALVDAVHAVDARVAVLDTRKTTPGLRALEKAAVRAGGGTNHRGSLSESILLKDNHLGALGIADGVGRAREAFPGTRVQVECDTADQVVAAVEAGADAVLLDNMNPEEARQCVAEVRERRPAVFIEASGRITVESAPAYAAAGVDAVSSGALTHSARALDLGLDLVEG